jgi:hypothetical protein
MSNKYNFNLTVGSSKISINVVETLQGFTSAILRPFQQPLVNSEKYI